MHQAAVFKVSVGNLELAKGCCQAFQEIGCRSVGASTLDVVNMCREDCNELSLTFGILLVQAIQAGVSWAGNTAELQEDSVEFGLPTLRRILQAVGRSQQTKNVRVEVDLFLFAVALTSPLCNGA